mmetsp:Transcript_17266/g.49473  ORF Transcript_17266/g.49473 Transcript_17266/m.49473 type:complete len:235 (-) Transcript_17266:773-1477(-)
MTLLSNRLQLLLILHIHHVSAFVSSLHGIQPFSVATRSAESDDAYFGEDDDDATTIPEGRVTNIAQWLTWSDKSLTKSCEDKKGGLYDRINELLGGESAETITTPQQVHESSRFAVLSHGNQTDPIYNYVNTAGFRVFRWPAEVYYRLPSRKSAPEGSARQQRAKVIDDTVAEDITYIEEAVRVRYPNDTVTLRDAILWNVYDDGGYRVGQTVLFDADKCSFGDDNRPITDSST